MMTSYVVRRMIYSIPAVFFILCLVFMLDNWAPGDRIAGYLELEGVRKSERIEIYQEAYRAKAKELNYHLPNFYFSLVPSYVPSEIAAILPLSERQTIKSLVHEIRDREMATKYIRLREQLALASDIPDDIKPLVSKSLNVTNLKELKALAGQMGRVDGAPNFIVQYARYASSLSGHSPLVILPSLRWYGFQNRFHQSFFMLFQWDSSVSLVDGRTVGQKVGLALKWTFVLGLIVLLISGIVSILLSSFIMLRPDRLVSRCLKAVIIFIYSIPEFWLGTMAVAFLTTDSYASWLHIFPSVGIKYLGKDLSFWEVFSQSAGQLVLPIIIMSIPTIAYLTHILLAEMKKHVKSHFVTMAKAKGLNEWRVITHHVLPNALLPFITVMTGAIPFLIGGSVIMEKIFSIPGAGRLLYDSINSGDWPVILPIVLLISIATVIAYALGDVITASIYPKTLATFSTTSGGR